MKSGKFLAVKIIKIDRQQCCNTSSKWFWRNFWSNSEEQHRILAERMVRRDI